MGFKNRMKVLFKSQLNYWVRQAEDPEKIIVHAVEEMEEGLDRARGRLAALRFRVDEEKRFLEKIGEQISCRQKRAEEFLRDDMEENAKDAVRKKRALEEEERKLKLRHKEDEEKLKKTETALKELESRVETAKSKRNVLIANMRFGKGGSGRTGEKWGEGRAGDVEESFSVFHKMEERVEAETEFGILKREKEKEVWEKEEKLINEEIEALRKNIKRGGIKK